jgi:hypothetical protein
MSEQARVFPESRLTVLINEKSSVYPADFINVYGFAFAGFDKLKLLDMRGE